MDAPIPAGAAAVIAALALRPLPGEGGYFRPTWRSESGSAILYLITVAEFSALHRLHAAEIWHFHAGDPVRHVQIDPRDGTGRATLLGANVLGGYSPQVVVPAGAWQAARLEGTAPPAAAGGWALVGCTMAPPWDERGFELAARDALLRRFPGHSEWIRTFTR